MARRPKLGDKVNVLRYDEATKSRVTVKMTREDLVIELVEQAVPQAQAALRAGIAESTFYLWKRKGREAAEANRNNQYRRFWDRLEEAQAKAEGKLVLTLQSHAQGDWRAAAFILERRFSERWAKREHIDATVHGVPGVTINALGNLSPEQLAKLAGTDLDDLDDLKLPTQLGADPVPDPDPTPED